MTPRQRWLTPLDGKSADRVPTDYQSTREVTSRLLRELDCPDEETLFDRLHVDARRFIEPRWKHGRYRAIISASNGSIVLAQIS